MNLVNPENPVILSLTYCPLVNHSVTIILHAGAVPIPIRLQHNLDAVILLVLEDFVRMRCVVKTHPVRYNEARIDVAVLNHL